MKKRSILKKKKRVNLGYNEKEQLRKCEKKGKKVMRDNVDDEEKEHLKKRGQQKKIKKSVITSVIMKKNK